MVFIVYFYGWVMYLWGNKFTVMAKTKYINKHIPLFSESVDRLNELMKDYGYSEFVPFIRFIVQKFINEHNKKQGDDKKD